MVQHLYGAQLHDDVNSNSGHWTRWHVLETMSSRKIIKLAAYGSTGSPTAVTPL